MENQLENATSCENIEENSQNISDFNSTFQPRLKDFQHAPTYVFIFVTILNVIIFCVGVFGNTLVIYVVCRVRAMRNPTNYFLFTLSIADLFVLLVCQPVALMEFYAKDRWYLGEVMCKVAPLLEHGMLHVSILMMMAMTGERFYAIKYPFKKQASDSDRITIKVIIGLWVIAYACTSPFLFITHLENAQFFDGSEVQVCRSLVFLLWHKAFIVAGFMIFFVLPFFVLVYMYSQIIRQLMSDSLMIMTNNDKGAKLTHRSRKQVVRMLIIIIILFFVSMCPIRVVSLWQIFTPVETLTDLGIESYYNIIWFARIMMYINSAGNPVIYSLTSTKFKLAFKRVLRRRYDPCKRSEYQRGLSETTQVLFRRSRKKDDRESSGQHGICETSHNHNQPNQDAVDANAIIIQIRFAQMTSQQMD